MPIVPCRCGCGILTRSVYTVGHDQKILHQRIALIGSVADFIDWFDALPAEAKVAPSKGLE